MNSRVLIVLFSVLLPRIQQNKDDLAEQEYYQQAHKLIESNNFISAVEKLRQLESRYPFGRYAEQAQLEMMYAYFMMADHDNVLATTERFIRLHPLHEQVDYAYYLRAVSTYEMAFPFVERFSDDQVERDPIPLKTPLIFCRIAGAFSRQPLYRRCACAWFISKSALPRMKSAPFII